MTGTDRNRSHGRTPARHGQGGAALFVGLMLLMVIAIIGISGVRSVIMEKSMATNNQYQMLVFQAAETAIEGTLADDTAFVDAINTPASGIWPSRSFNVAHASNPFTITSDAIITVGSPAVPVGYTIGEFVSYPFTVTGVGVIASINATDTHVQTAARIAPYLH